MKKYNLVNNALGWTMFLIAAVTYLLTMEPTASFWDCPEFIAQGYKLEVGHPPGNPVFILVARFATLFAGGDVTAVAKCVNAMSALLSAGTILLLFWTITHLVKKLVVKRGEEDSMTLSQYLVVMGSGVAGALAYTWSDTFWFSAVEAEVYAFSSFCTALVFWLILKWEDRADDPSSDRYLLLIAYVMGLSLGVHLLNLLCLPAIALVFYYRKWKEPNVKGSLIALGVSFVLLAAILYGLEQGFVRWAEYFELAFVNGLGLGFNMGALLYAVVLIAALAWNVWELHRQKSELMIKVSFAVAMFFSGVFFLTGGWVVAVLLIGAFAFYLFKSRLMSRRIMANITLSVLLIFIGFSSYALILIRSNAYTPLDESAPNSPFALMSYLSRDQYGKSPLFYGPSFLSPIQYEKKNYKLLDRKTGKFEPIADTDFRRYGAKMSNGEQNYYRSVDGTGKYIAGDYKQDIVSGENSNMIFPRLYDNYSAKHIENYAFWLGLKTTKDEHGYVTIDEVGSGEYFDRVTEPNTTVDQNGNMASSTVPSVPYSMNLEYLFKYQLNHMYWRYFGWNFIGRQNDLSGTQNPDVGLMRGNVVTGIPFIDNARLGDQSLLPDDIKNNKGHNVFYCLPLLMGLIGLFWQAFSGKRGIQQFWVVFFLFFMTGVAIVFYLNQPPNQPRERDYAFAGSFYAFAIWIGMGVAGLWRLAMLALKNKKAAKESEESSDTAVREPKGAFIMAAVAALIGLAVPLQMVSQTWDDHDRSGRYAAHDFGMNYLSSVDENAIIFCNGDNDTFPLWYLQEVEGYRTDVRTVNLSYLGADWYVQQLRRPAYDGEPVPMQADEKTFAYGGRNSTYLDESFNEPTPLYDAITDSYKINTSDPLIMPTMISNVYIPIDPQAAIDAGVVDESQREMIEEEIRPRVDNGMGISEMMTLDIVSSCIKDGWKRPVYFAVTVPDSYYMGLKDYMKTTGFAYQVTPVKGGGSSTDKMYDIVTTKFRWGGFDEAEPGSLYVDETIANMVANTRLRICDLANDLVDEGVMAKKAKEAGKTEFLGKPVDEYITDRFAKAKTVLVLVDEKIPEASCSYDYVAQPVAETYAAVAKASGDKECRDRACEITRKYALLFAQHVRFYNSLSPELRAEMSQRDLGIAVGYFGDNFAAALTEYKAQFEQLLHQSEFSPEDEHYMNEIYNRMLNCASYGPIALQLFDIYVSLNPEGANDLMDELRPLYKNIDSDYKVVLEAKAYARAVSGEEGDDDMAYENNLAVEQPVAVPDTTLQPGASAPQPEKTPADDNGGTPSTAALFPAEPFAVREENDKA